MTLIKGLTTTIRRLTRTSPQLNTLTDGSSRSPKRVRLGKTPNVTDEIGGRLTLILDTFLFDPPKQISRKPLSRRQSIEVVSAVRPINVVANKGICITARLMDAVAVGTPPHVDKGSF